MPPAKKAAPAAKKATAPTKTAPPAKIAKVAQQAIAKKAELQVIPRLFDQNLCAHSRMPMDMTRHGWASSLFHVSQQ